VKHEDMKHEEVEIRPAKSSEIIDLRHRVLRAGLPRATALFDGDDLPTTKHFAAEHDGKIIACATMLLNEWNGEPAWQVRGMAVEPNFRGRGIGRELLDAIESAAGDVRLLWCNARTSAIEFYRTNGWTIASDEIEIRTAGPHFKMTKVLAAK
jgi:GNAT superfamily N-acetyltransferase